MNNYLFQGRFLGLRLIWRFAFSRPSFGKASPSFALIWALPRRAGGGCAYAPHRAEPLPIGPMGRMGPIGPMGRDSAPSSRPTGNSRAWDAHITNQHSASFGQETVRVFDVASYAWDSNAKILTSRPYRRRDHEYQAGRLSTKPG